MNGYDPNNTENRQTGTVNQAPKQYVYLNGMPVESLDESEKKTSRTAVKILLIIFIAVIAAALITTALLPGKSPAPDGGKASSIFGDDDGDDGSHGSGAFGELIGGLDSVSQDGPYADRATVHYSKMEYRRPNLALFLDSADAIADICDTADYDEIAKALDDLYSLYWTFDTMYCLADLRSCIDTTDEFYASECSYFSENSPIVEQKMDELFYALAACPIADELDKNYFGGDFLIYYVGESTFDDTLVALYQEESDLIYQFQTLSSFPEIEINGETVDYYTYIYEVYDDDEAYDEALRQYYLQYNEAFAEVFIGLVKVRTEIAEVLGYDNYMQYAYESFSRDYTYEEIDAYLDTVCRGAVPIYKELSDAGTVAELYDCSTMTERENAGALQAMAEAMGGRVKEIYDYMELYGLYDITITNDKLTNSFQTYLEDWNAPFIMLDTYGYITDYTAFAHEFGHFIDAYINYNSYITIDASEVCAQAMEYLSCIYAGEDIRKELLDIKMADAVCLYAEQGAYNAFEEAVYSMPAGELTAEVINKTAYDCFLEYGLISEDAPITDAMTWMDVTHFFWSPFYIVSYITSHDGAIQIYEAELNEAGAGVDLFERFADRRWDMSFTENLEYIGLDASFSVKRANEIVDFLDEYFD